MYLYAHIHITRGFKCTKIYCTKITGLKTKMRIKKIKEKKVYTVTLDRQSDKFGVCHSKNVFIKIKLQQ